MTFLLYIEYQNFTRIHIEEIILQVLILFEESIIFIKRVQLMHTLNLSLLHFTCMFDYNYKSYFILSWNLNSLHILFLNNIHYRYMNTCVVCHSIKKNK